ncbi:MAG TPA: TIGR00266 family protein [Methanoregulaceae archaeon]|nr:TIGR00266 family protein [Methanoregulaceae archaeon]
MKHEITGDNLQQVTLRLDEGECVFAEAGAMVNMSGNINMTTEVKGGLFKGLKRVVTGESFFITEFSPESGKGFVSFAGNVPGKIFPVFLQGNEFIAQKDAFLCSEAGVDLDIAFTKKLGSGLFGGEGFILQRYSGNGYAFLHCCGDIIELILKPGEIIRVSTGLVVGFESSVDYDISLAGGVKSVLFAGEGLFLTTLTGPGKVILQSMDLARLAASLKPYLPSQTSGDERGKIPGQSFF